MKGTCRRLRAPAALLVAIIFSGDTLVLASQAPQQSSPEIAIVSFLVPITNGTINQLLQVVTGLSKNGTHKVIILVSSTGGDTMSAFAAYNVLRNMRVEITTFNVGNVDSAANVLYCAGRNRYSLPGTRFLFHGNSLDISGNVSLSFDAATIEAQLLMLRNLNQTIVRVLAQTTKKKEEEIGHLVIGQTIFTPEQAKTLGLVQEIKADFMEPGATMISINTPLPVAQRETLEFTSSPSRASRIKP